MPSSHSQFIWFSSTYLILWILFYKPHFSSFYYNNSKKKHHHKSINNSTFASSSSSSTSPSLSKKTKLELFDNSNDVLYKSITVVFLLLLALAVSFSRVYLFYHTDLQVLVGSAVGIVFAAGWISIVFLLRKFGIVDWVLDWPIIKWFYIKDTSLSSYSFIQDEYYRWRKDRKRGKLLVKAD